MSIATEIERIKKAKENIINTLKAKDVQIEETATIDEVDIVMNDVPILDTSDATATANDILLNKTAYVNGQKLIGSIEATEEPFPQLYEDDNYISATGLLEPWSFVVTFDRQYLIYLTSDSIIVRHLESNTENRISLADNNLDSNFDMISCSIIQNNKIYITLAQTQGNVVGYCLYDLVNNIIEKTHTLTLDKAISKWNRPLLIRYNTIFDKFIYFNCVKKTDTNDVSTAYLSIIDMTNNTISSYTLGDWGVYAFIDKYDRFIRSDTGTYNYFWLDENGNCKNQTGKFDGEEYRTYIYENDETFAYIPEDEIVALATIDTEKCTITLGERESIKYAGILPDDSRWEERRDMIALNKLVFSQYINYFSNLGTSETEYFISIGGTEALPVGKYAYLTNTTFEDGNLYYVGNSEEGKIYLEGIDLSEKRIASIKIGEDTLYNPIFGD